MATRRVHHRVHHHRRHHSNRRRHSYNPRRRRNAILMRSHHRRHNRRYNRMRMNYRRRNPNGVAGMSMTDLLWMVGGGGVNFLIARSGPQMLLPQFNTGIVGYGLDAAFGAVGAWGIGKFNRRAGIGAWVGLGLALISRFVSENFGAGTAAATGGMSGDLDFDLGYYVSQPFPFPQGAAAGPYHGFPGTPYAPAIAPVTAAAATRAGAAAATAALAAAPAAAVAAPASVAPAGTGWRASGRWG
jgi:hypothetical protein